MSKKKSSREASATSRHREVECKFDVDDVKPTPSFDGAAAVADVKRKPPQTLRAVYFDTPGGDLAAHRVTLRRRTGGTDAGWHLKLPAGIVEHTEIRTELGGGDDAEVPAALRDVVLAIVRDRPLQVVARITNHRTIDVLYDRDGAPIAEFCDDRVSAVAAGEDNEQHWREWELELAEEAFKSRATDEGLLAQLSKLLLDAGAQPARHASKLARALNPSTSSPRPLVGQGDSAHSALAQQLEALLTWDRAVRADLEDSVHQMRVTIRTIRSILQISPSAFGLTEEAPVFAELRQLTDILGTARDAEVLADRYQRALDELPENLVCGPIRDRLVDGSHRRYRAGCRGALQAMRSRRYLQLLDILDSLRAAEAVDSEASRKKDKKKHWAEAAITDGYKRVRKRAKAAAASDDAEQHDAALHSIRKSAKRLRYTAAAVGARKVAEAAKAIQTLLGDHHDSVVSRAHLVEQAQLAHAAGEDTFTYGVLHQRDADFADQCEVQLRAALQSLRKAVRAAC